MKYALLIHTASAGPEGAGCEPGPIDAPTAAVLSRPAVSGWVRLQNSTTATTLRQGGGRSLLTDGPFVDAKEVLAGIVLVDADDLDGALAVAADMMPAHVGGAIEVRPVLEQVLGG